MGAHRRQIVRSRNHQSGRRRGSRYSETASEGDGSSEWESGNLVSEAQSQDGSPQQADHEAKALDHGCRGGGSLAHGTLIRIPSSYSGGGAGDGMSGKEGGGKDDSTARTGQQQFTYHPDASCSDQTGYMGRLTWAHEAALGALRQWLTRESVDLTPIVGEGGACPPEDEDLALLRFLRRNGWDVELTRAQLEASLAWKAEASVSEALHSEPWEVLGFASEEVFERVCRAHYPHYTLGADRQGRPVLVQKYGNFNTSKLVEYTTLDGLLLYHAWEQEKNAELLRRSTLRTGYLVDTYAIIMDFGGMGLSLVNPDFLWLLRELSEMDRKHYPGRGGVTYVINTPPLFGIVWGSIRRFMESTQSRIHILSKEEEWKAALAEAIDPCQLPPEYGGTGPALADTPLLPAVHRALERDATRVAVEVDGAGAAGGSSGDDGGISGESGGGSGGGGSGGRLVALETAVEASLVADHVVAGSMSSLLQHFSLSSGDFQFECNSSAYASSSSGETGGGGGGSPVVFRDSSSGGSGGGGFMSGGIGGGGGGLCAVDDAVKERYGSDFTRKSLREQAMLNAANAGIGKETAPQPPHGLENAGDEGAGGDLEWVLSVVPGARLVVGIAGNVASVTVGATFGAAGVAAGLLEAVIPGPLWAEGMQAFQSSQMLGRWFLRC